MSNGKEKQTARIRLAQDAAYFSGDWVALCLASAERQFADIQWSAISPLVWDFHDIATADTAGAWLLSRSRRRLVEQGRQVVFRHASTQLRALLALVDRDIPLDVPLPVGPGLLESVARRATEMFRQTVEFLAFIGEIASVALLAIARPRRLRMAMLLHNLEAAGFRALPIVGLLSFLIGVVIAYQGGVQLETYGANIFIADLVGISLARELSPLMTAVIVAGRTGSAYTAQIGTMKVTDEIDAMRTMGIRPLELLVLPKVLALMLALPLLTVFANITGLLGGMLIADLSLDVSPASFMERIGEAVSTTSYLIGIGKAPVFAAIIGAVGCYQGMEVRDTAESVGRQTTVSVVQSIFLVIVVDAFFSVLFSKMGL